MQNRNVFTIFFPLKKLTTFLVKQLKTEKLQHFSRLFSPLKNQQFFLGNQNFQILKSAKPQRFREFVFYKKKIDYISREIKVVEVGN